MVIPYLGLSSLPMGLPGWLSGKESACNAGDLGSFPRLARSPGGGHDNENPMDRGVWRAAVHSVTRSQT